MAEVPRKKRNHLVVDAHEVEFGTFVIFGINWSVLELKRTFSKEFGELLFVI